MVHLRGMGGVERDLKARKGRQGLELASMTHHLLAFWSSVVGVAVGVAMGVFWGGASPWASGCTVCTVSTRLPLGRTT